MIEPNPHELCKEIEAAITAAVLAEREECKQISNQVAHDKHKIAAKALNEKNYSLESHRLSDAETANEIVARIDARPKP